MGFSKESIGSDGFALRGAVGVIKERVNMKKVSIKRDWLIRAKQRARLNPEELEKVESYVPKSNIHSFDAAFDELPREIWSEMLNDSKLTSKPRAMIALFVFGMGASEICLLYTSPSPRDRG